MESDDDNVFDFEELDDRRKKKKERRSCIMGHLASPITEYDCEFLLNTPKEIFSGCKRHKRLREKIDQLGNVRLIRDVTNDPISLIQNWIRHETVSTHVRQKLLQYSTENILIHKMNFQRPLWASDHEYKKLLLRKINNYCVQAQEILVSLDDSLADMMKVEKIKDNVCFKSIIEGNCRTYKGLMAEGDICILETVGGGNVICSTNLVLCALDKLQGRFNMLLYAKLADVLRKYEGVSMYQALVHLIDKFEEIRPKCNNEFFDITNTYESLILGWAVADDEDLGCKELFLTSYKDIKDVLDSYDIDEKFIETILPPNRGDHTVRMYIELSGIVKCFGYPILDVDTTLKQVLEYGVRDNYQIDMELIDDLEGLARRDICINYYRKNKKLPVILECPNELRNLKKGRLPPITMNKRYELWRRVRFGKTLEYDYSPDQSELIKDSAAAVNTSSWANMYDPCAFRAHYGKPPPFQEKPKFKNRILLEYIKSTPERVKELVDERDSGILSKENHVCVLCQKECEINRYGRSFTKQTPEQRLVQVSMEHNIADQIFPLVPEQSMIDSEIKNVRRNLNQVKGMQGSSQFINLDLKKWCLHQRHSANEYLGKMYDELFGMKTLFKNSHLFFNGCSIFPNHRLIPPDYDSQGNPIESKRFTKEFIGGMEGMQQKKWTHGAIVLIKYVMEENGLKGEVMGQGDNQVILLHFSKSDTLANEKREAFLTSLEMYFRRIGHKLKTKETWYSKYLHEYSKQRIYKGSAVSFAMKKCTKVMADINDGLFSIPSSLSTINTITESIARADYDPDIAFTMNSINITNFLHRKGILTSRSTKEDVLFFLNWPIDFGGVNVSTYHSHTVRGNDDKVSIWLSLLDTMREFNPSIYDLCLQRWVMAPVTKPTSAMDRKNLYEDIHSLNIGSPPSAESKIKDLVKDFLTGPEVTNPAIRILYDHDHSASYNDIIEDVDKIRPVFPSLGHELLSNSNAGLFIRLQGKLTNSKTLEKIVNETQHIPLIDLIRDMNQKLVAYLKRRMREDRTSINLLLIEQRMACVTRIANKLRKESWDVDIIGVTKPSWAHQCIVKRMDDCTAEERQRGITVRVSGEAIDAPDLCQKIYGPMKPFVGSTTKEKVHKKSTLAIQDKSSWSRSIIKLGKVKSWLTRIGDKGSIDLCNRLMSEKKSLIKNSDTNWDEIEEGLLSSVGGNLFHRFKSSIDRDTAMVNCLPSVTGHFDYSSNTMKTLTAGGKDYNVFYQYIYTACTEALAMMGRDTGEFSPMYMILFPDCDCFMETPNPQLRMTSGPTYSGDLLPPKEGAEDITHRRGADGLKRSASFLLGQEVSRNIDQNYRLSHQQGDITLSSTEYKKEHISINDMRLIDLSIFLKSCFLFSSHCRELFMSKDVLLLMMSEDRSFLYLAELILEADLVPALISFVGKKTNSHSGICSVFGISAYISRNMPTIMRNILRDKSDIFLMRFADDDFNKWLGFFRFLTKAEKKITGILDKRSYGKLIDNLNNFGNLGKMVKDSGLNIEFEEEERDSLISAWKLSDRGTDIQVRIRFVSIGVKILAVDRYPLTEVGDYHASRARSRFGRLRVSQLSFLSRPLGSISSGGNKALETLIATGLYWHLSDIEGYLYCLAEGSGSILTILGLAFPGLKIVYNTWMKCNISGRDKGSDTCVPAWVDLGLDDSRIIKENTLIVGETDITHPRFMEKMFKMIKEFKPSLVTMDAESSVKTNNVDFLIKTILPIALACDSIFLIKLFHMVKLAPILEKVLKPIADRYRWVIYKPVSSNPVGSEVYLVMCPTDRVTAQFQDCVRLQGYVETYVNNNMNMNPTSVEKYMSLSTTICNMLRDIFPTGQLDIEHTFKRYEGEYFCNLFCPRFLDHFIDLVDTQHLSETNLASHLACRSKGINVVLYNRVHELVFLFLFHTQHHDMYNKLWCMSTCRVTEDMGKCRREGKGFVTLTAPGDGDIWGTWVDARMYLREYGKLRNMCDCSAPRRVWTWDIKGKFNPCNSFTWQVFSCLVDLRLVDWDLYLSFRSEPQEMSLSKLDSRVCNYEPEILDNRLLVNNPRLIWDDDFIEPGSDDDDIW